MYILTVVVPAYNSGKFLHVCIDSLLNKKNTTELEIIIVDDGSTDDTGFIASEYARKHENVVAVSKENGNHGSVINLGIRMARGKYFKVVDSDDWLDTKNLDKLINDLKKTDADIILNSYVTFDVSRNSRQRVVEYCLENGKKYAVDDLKHHGIDLLQIYAITIKTKILRDNNITFTEKCFYEDFQFVLYPLEYANSVEYYNYPVYYYQIGQKNQSVNSQNALINVGMLQTVLEDAEKHYWKIDDTKLDYKGTFYNALIILARQGYNVFIKNYKYPNITNFFSEYDSRLWKNCNSIYQDAGKRYYYIRYIRKNTRFRFMVCYFLLRIYKLTNGMPSIKTRKNKA